MDRPWRCFVAVPLGGAQRASLHASLVSSRERADLADLRWTDSDGWHVTLAFLGPVEPDSVTGLIELLTSVGNQPGMSVRTAGFGAFPTPAFARVAWYGVEDADGRLAGLASDVARALSLRVTQPFRAHVTMARAPGRPVDLRSWLASASAPEGVLEVDRIALMRSHVGGGPGRYETLTTIPLGVSDGV